METVAIVRARTDYSDVEQAVRRAVALAGGVPGLSPGANILVKPNVLNAGGGETGSTTHKAVVGALVSIVQEAAARAIVGDSSGLRFHGASERALTGTGIRAHCEALGAEVVSFDSARPVAALVPGARVLEEAYFAEPELVTDTVISAAKLKTHALTMFTGAVKNLFGTLPGGQKTIAHRLAPTPELFAELLADILSLIRPRFALMDAVVGLGGLWRSAADRVYPGLIIAGRDSVAVDAVAAAIIGFDPLQIPHLRAAHERGLGVADLKVIETVGLDLREISAPRLAPGRATRILRQTLFKLMGMVLSKQDPFVEAALCNGCRNCLAACPAEAISFADRAPSIALDRCIRCFCCHELCPERAIGMDRGIIGNRLLSTH